MQIFNFLNIITFKCFILHLSIYNKCVNMNCWKNNFNEKTLRQGLKYKNNVENISYDGHTFKASIKSKNEFNVELVLQDNILFDMSCSCSKKSSCAHEAGVLYFLEEFPEILKDFTDDSEYEKIADNDINNELKVISESKLKKFLKKEFKKTLNSNTTSSSSSARNP